MAEVVIGIPCFKCGSKKIIHDRTPDKFVFPDGVVYYSTQDIQRCECGEEMVRVTGNSCWSEASPQGRRLAEIHRSLHQGDKNDSTK